MTEIELLEKVEMKLALTDSELEFEKQLAVLLCPVLLKLDSTDEAVVNKVIAILSHVNKRYKSASTIRLPIQKLLNLYTDSNGLLVKSFTLIYLEMGFNSTHYKLLPSLVYNIHKKPASQQAVLFAIALPLFSNFTYDNCIDLPDDPFQFERYPNDLKFWLDKFLDIMLYQVPASKKLPVNALNSQANASITLTSPLECVPLGLSKSRVSFVTNNLKAKWMHDNVQLKALKVDLMKMFLIEKIFSKEAFLNERYLVYIVATSDSAHEVQFSGEDGIKRISKPDFESMEFVLKLYTLYQGTPTVPNTHGIYD